MPQKFLPQHSSSYVFQSANARLMFELIYTPPLKVLCGKYQLVASDLKQITRKTKPSSISERIQELKSVQRGWINYHRMGSIYGKLRALDGWLRNRLRYCIWHGGGRSVKKMSSGHF